jgi:hypothetical protein
VLPRDQEWDNASRNGRGKTVVLDRKKYADSCTMGTIPPCYQLMKTGGSAVGTAAVPHSAPKHAFAAKSFARLALRSVRLPRKLLGALAFWVFL